jgi:hypothetical protein
MDPIVTWHDQEYGPLEENETVRIGANIRNLNVLDSNPNYFWRLVNGPGTALFEDLNSLYTHIVFAEAGYYELELVVRDAGTDFSNFSNSATLTLLVGN